MSDMSDTIKARLACEHGELDRHPVDQNRSSLGKWCSGVGEEITLRPFDPHDWMESPADTKAWMEVTNGV